MSIHYKDNEQIVIEIKKLMLEKQISQREIAEQLKHKAPRTYQTTKQEKLWIRRCSKSPLCNGL
ncbi:MAG: hypothetical protein ACLURP_04575 [Ruminococcus sp.]